MKRREASHFEGPYFGFPGAFPILEKIHQSYPFESHEDLAKLFHSLSNPCKLRIESISSSSNDPHYPVINLVTFNNHLWVSMPSESQESVDSIIVNLSQESLIFSINFKVGRLKLGKYRLTFPPVSFKVLIGFSESEFFYESLEFPVSYSENYNTLMILPEIVKGKCIKVLLIGKKCRDSNGWLCSLKFLEVVGFDGMEDQGLKMIENRNFSDVLEEISPFYMERIQRFGLIEEFFNSPQDYENDTAAYFCERYRDQFNFSHHFKSCEMVANYFFHYENDFKALSIYRDAKDPFGVIRVFIVLKNFAGIQKILNEVGGNISLDHVFDIACGIKGKKFGQKIMIEMNNYLIGA